MPDLVARVYALQLGLLELAVGGAVDQRLPRRRRIGPRVGRRRIARGARRVPRHRALHVVDLVELDRQAVHPSERMRTTASWSLAPNAVSATITARATVTVPTAALKAAKPKSDVRLACVAVALLPLMLTPSRLPAFAFTSPTTPCAYWSNISTMLGSKSGCRLCSAN